MGLEVVCVGESIVDLIPIEEGLYKACFGGAPMNTAAACSRLGLTVGVLTSVGLDPFGDLIVNTLKAYGVDTSHIHRSRFRTTVAVVFRLPGGEREYLFYRKPWSLSADTELKLDELDIEYVLQAKLLHLSGFSLSQNPAREEIFRLIGEAKRRDIAVSVDPTFRSDVWPSLDEARRVYRRVLEEADVVLATLTEFKVVFGLDSLDGAFKKAEDYGWKLLGVKMGGAGGILYSKGEAIGLNAFQVDVADTVGAGDAWNAAILYGFLRGLSLEDSLTLANATAAIKCTRIGAVEGLPTIEEVYRFIERRGKPEKFRF